jgi:hypothetical protein
MDHEIIPRPCKICDWLLNLSWDHFGSHQGQNVRVTLEFEVPKRHILGPTLYTTWFNEFCDGRGKRGALVEKR